MIYRAVIRFGYNIISCKFKTVQEAEEWILSKNNNLESTSFIQEIDNKGNVVDWFYYTEKKE